MLEKIKDFIAQIIFKRKFKYTPGEVLPYKEFFSNSLDFFIILPLDESDFRECNDVLTYLKIHKKFLTIFIPEHKWNLFQEAKDYKFITYTHEEVTKFNLPSKELIAKIKEKQYDCLIDLTRHVSIFNAAIANLLSAKYKIGFGKKDGKAGYNFQVSLNEINAEISYKNLLNSLRMF